MTDDLVDRLRNERSWCEDCQADGCRKRGWSESGYDVVVDPPHCSCECHWLYHEAADEIERLRRHVGKA
jgi:uncharacterized protein (DUF427 family)